MANIHKKDDFFNDFLNIFTVARMDKSPALNAVVNSESYKTASAERSRLFKEIKSKLGPEDQKLIFDYESTMVSQFAVESDAYYVQGLKDGERFRELLTNESLDFARLVGVA